MEKIDELTEIVTLEKLASEGRFISVEHNLPRDLHTINFKISLDAKVLFCNITGEAREEKIFIRQAYAHPIEGWIVGYIPGKLGCVVILKGNVEIITGI